MPHPSTATPPAAATAPRAVIRADRRSRGGLALLLPVLLPILLAACASDVAIPADTAPEATPQIDHLAAMKRRLGIEALHPGRSPDASGPAPANYDEARANPWPALPDPLTTFAGARVATADQWPARRAEIADVFEREIYGRVPASAPDIAWTVTATTRDVIEGVPVVSRRVTGAPTRPRRDVPLELHLLVVTPADPPAPVPVLIMLGPDDATPPPVRDHHGDLPRQQLLIARGWGYAMLDTDSVQPDHDAGLSTGVIGHAADGGERAPEDWGVLRAWAWGASRAFDFLAADPAVDRARIGVEGVSRYGKAALVAMAFDERLAVGLVASSGKGGTTLLRRDFGESVTNLANPGAYHWMAGNFIRYASADPGAPTPGDLPVDAHQLIALAAPRPLFISVGIPEQGDALWIDQLGTFMATVAASPVYELLGVPGLRPAPADPSRLPPLNTGLLDGRLGWRQHDGGHTDRPNIPYFVDWANAQLGER